MSTDGELKFLHQSNHKGGMVDYHVVDQ